MASSCSPLVARCSENLRSGHAKGANTSHRKTPRATNVAEAAAPAKQQARNTPRYRPTETRANSYEALMKGLKKSEDLPACPDTAAGERSGETGRAAAGDNPMCRDVIHSLAKLLGKHAGVPIHVDLKDLHVHA